MDLKRFVGNLCLVLALISVTVTSVGGQENPVVAGVDRTLQLVVGANTLIRSKFKGMPLVEPHVSAHPGNNQHLLVAAMVVTDVDRPYESCRLSSFVSQDGGLTWIETAHDWWDYDPWTAILPDGQTVMSWIGTPGRFIDQYPIQFFSSTDGGVHWSDRVQTLEGMYDGTKLVALNGDFYFTTVRFRESSGCDVILCRKSGSGEFQEVGRIDGGGQRLGFCEAAILPNGKVVVPAFLQNSRIWVQIFDPATKSMSDSKLVTDLFQGSKGYMRMAADVSPSSSVQGSVYLVRAAGAENKYLGVWCNTSTDGGETWSKNTRIDLFEPAQPSRAMAASVAVNNTGVVGVSWVDCQNDPDGKLLDVYFAASRDGGKSFSRPVRVSSESSNPHTQGNADVANKFTAGGHYLGLAAKPDGSFQLVWSDSRNGIFELQTSNVAIRQ